MAVQSTNIKTIQLLGFVYAFIKFSQFCVTFIIISFSLSIAVHPNSFWWIFPCAIYSVNVYNAVLTKSNARGNTKRRSLLNSHLNVIKLLTQIFICIVWLVYVCVALIFLCIASFCRILYSILVDKIIFVVSVLVHHILRCACVCVLCTLRCSYNQPSHYSVSESWLFARNVYVFSVPVAESLLID